MELNDPILTPEEVKEPTLNQELNAAVAETPEKSEPSAQTVSPGDTPAEAEPTEAAETEHTVRRSLTKPEILEEVTRLSGPRSGRNTGRGRGPSETAVLLAAQ